MTAFLPRPPSGHGVDAEAPRLQQRPLTPAEQRARWAVRAAQWRARELAEAVFGRVERTTLVGVQPFGALRGLLELEVPFGGLEAHLAREEAFLAAVRTDPILSEVPLVYAFAPERA